MKRSNFSKIKEESLSNALIKIGRLINRRGLESARINFAFPDLKQVHLDLFPYIDFEGTTVSEIASRKDVSKQAVSKLVAEMVAMQLLSINANKNDSRSKLVSFKTSGKHSIQNGFKALVAIDKLIKDDIGEKNYSLILKNLESLLKTIEI